MPDNKAGQPKPIIKGGGAPDPTYRLPTPPPPPKPSK